MVHAIGKGILLAEIQQSSDITYRIYDWNRTGLNGKPRELHTDLAIDAINFSALPDKRTEKHIETDYFQIERIEITDSKTLDISAIDSFIILMNTGAGNYTIDGIDFSIGKTLLVPAVSNHLEINTFKPGEFLMIYV